jgi:hypothetical protein
MRRLNWRPVINLNKIIIIFLMSTEEGKIKSIYIMISMMESYIDTVDDIIYIEYTDGTSISSN